MTSHGQSSEDTGSCTVKRRQRDRKSKKLNSRIKGKEGSPNREWEESTSELYVWEEEEKEGAM
jgi:hypothetical protein